MLVYCSYRITFIFFHCLYKNIHTFLMFKQQQYAICILVYCLYRYIHSTCSLFEKKNTFTINKKIRKCTLSIFDITCIFSHLIIAKI